MIKKRLFLLLSGLVLLLPASASALSECQRKVIDSGVGYFDCERATICNNIGIVNGSVDRFLQVLAFQESGGNPLADASPASDASGKYQYLNSTWQSRVDIYGPAGQYKRAKDAPEAVQDAVAYIEYTQKFKDLGGDLFKLAVSHFYPLANDDPSQLDVIIGHNTITPREYADKLIANMGTDIGKDIQLHYTEAPEFSTWLAKIGGSAPTVNAGGGGCSSSALGGTIVEIAEREAAAGANEADGSYLKYGGGQGVAWCAYFVSWVLNEAGKPFEGGTIGAVVGVLAYGQNKGYYHPKGETGFVPQPGDIVIYNEGLSPYPQHVNFVISYDPASNEITTIGGNEGNAVKKLTWSADMPAITGFVRIP